MAKNNFTPEFVKRYAVVACIFSVICIMMFGVIGGMALYFITKPPVTTLENFTIQDAQGLGVQIGLLPENKSLFEKIDLEDFRTRPEYYFNIAKNDSARRLPEIAINMVAFTLLFIVVFVVHFRLWRRDGKKSTK